MTNTYFIHRINGTTEEVDADKFQSAIDKDLAVFNGGDIPTTDEERREAIACAKKDAKINSIMKEFAQLFCDGNTCVIYPNGPIARFIRSKLTELIK